MNQSLDTSDCERRRPRGAQRSCIHNLLLDHANYVLCKGVKICNRNMLTRFSQRIFNPMRYTGNVDGRIISYEFYSASFRYNIDEE